MFDDPRPQAKIHTRGVRFTDTELATVRKLMGKRTFSAYIRDLINRDFKKQRSK